MSEGVVLVHHHNRCKTTRAKAPHRLKGEFLVFRNAAHFYMEAFGELLDYFFSPLYIAGRAKANPYIVLALRLHSKERIKRYNAMHFADRNTEAPRNMPLHNRGEEADKFLRFLQHRDQTTWFMFKLPYYVVQLFCGFRIVNLIPAFRDNAFFFEFNSFVGDLHKQCWRERFRQVIDYSQIQ